MTRSSEPEAGIRVAVSTVILTLRRDGALQGPQGPSPRIALPLVRRTRDPYQGSWALPGGWLDAQEGLTAAAARTLAETTGLAPSYLEQLYAFGAVDRSPSRVISVVYWALLREEEAADAVGSDPENVAWFDAAELPELAFDHARIIEYALWRLRNKAGYSRVAQGFLPPEFTLADLREAYEAILGRKLDPANFRRQVDATRTLVPTNAFRTGSHRPARLYRDATDVELADRGPLSPAETTVETRTS